MRSRRAVMMAGCGIALLAAGSGAWVLLGPGRLTAAVARADRAGAAAANEDRAPAPAPFGVAAQGRIEPASEKYELAIGLVGTLGAVYVDEGDTVKKGQLLAELVNNDQKARVAEAEAQVSLRKAEIEKLLNGARPEERRGAAAQFERTEASLALAKLQVARQRPLAAKGVVTQDTLDQTASSLLVAQANDDGNKAALELINAPPRSEDVAIDRANLALAEGNLAEQRALLEKTQLLSPIDGVVFERYLKTGETISIQPLIPILQVGDMRRLRVRAQVDETDIARLELGQRVTVTAPAYPDRRFGGAIARIGQKMGPKTVRSDEPTEKNDTNILSVLINLDDPGVRLPSGLRVNVFVGPAHIARN
jgi:HlyD family secretion protein